MAPWGCCSPTSTQASSASSRSSPGNTTAPAGRVAISFKRSALAGAVPVEPAAIIGNAGGRLSQPSASSRSSRTRRAAGSIRPSSRRRAAQPLSAKARKPAEMRQCRARSPSTSACIRSVRPSSATSSSSIPSRNAARASASSSAEVASSERPSRCSCALTRRASSNRRRKSPMAGFRARAASPGSNGGSPSSRSPRARIWGNNSPLLSLTRRNASASSRTLRRDGSKTTASESPSAPRASVRPFARSSRNGRCGAMVNQRGPGPAKGPAALTPAPPAGACAPPHPCRQDR